MTWIDEAEKRCEAATKGPWYAAEYGDVDGLPSESYLHGPNGPQHIDTHAFDYETADFIAHARTDLPRALRVIRAVEERVKLAIPGAASRLIIVPLPVLADDLLAIIEGGDE